METGTTGLKPYAVGMDIGGTNTVMGIVDREGNVLATDSVKTSQYERVDEYVEAVCDKLLPMMEKAGDRELFRGMGIGAPNANYYRGTIEQAPNLPWKGTVHLAEMFKQQTGLPVAMTNDANAAALGEMMYGAARGMRDFIVITLGTGVGSGIVVNGQVVYGHDGFAGELGHVCVDRSQEARLCGCGRRGCLETYCSATGVARTAQEVMGVSLTSKEVYDAAVKGGKSALEIFRRTGDTLGRALADFIAFSSPEAIILFGGLTKAGEYLMKPLREAVEEHVMPIYRGKTQIMLSALKDADAAVLGASALGWEAI